MLKYNRVGKMLLLAMLMLSVLALTGCPSKPQVILQSSAPMKILPGDLPKSPNSKGWLLSDEATARLLEAAEACKGVNHQ